MAGFGLSNSNGSSPSSHYRTSPSTHNRTSPSSHYRTSPSTHYCTSPSSHYRTSPTQVKLSDSGSISGSLGDSRYSRTLPLERDIPYGKTSPAEVHSLPEENLSTGSNAAAAISNYGNGEVDLGPTHSYQTPNDIIYPYDVASFDTPKKDHVIQPASDPKSRLTRSEPIPTRMRTQRSVLGSIEAEVESGGSSTGRRELRRYSSALEDRIEPWRPQKGKPLAQFDDNYSEKFIREEPIGTSRGKTFAGFERLSEQPSLKETYRSESRPSGDFDSSKSHSTNPFDDDCSQLSNPFDFASYEQSGHSEMDQQRNVRDDSDPITSKHESSGEQKPRNWRNRQERSEAVTDAAFLQTPSVEVSTSMPAQSLIHSYMASRESDSRKSGEESSLEVLEKLYFGHRRSKSSDCHPVKSNKILPNQGKYVDPFEPPPVQLSRDATKPSSKGSSPRGSLRSLENVDSPRGSKGNIAQGYSSGERRSRGSHGYSSSEKTARGYTALEKPSRGYHSSSEKPAKG